MIMNIANNLPTFRDVLNWQITLREGLNGLFELPTLGGASSESPTFFGARQKNLEIEY